MPDIETYGDIPMLKKLFKKAEKMFNVKKGFIPLNMSVGLAMDLKKQGLTK